MGASVILADPSDAFSPVLYEEIHQVAGLNIILFVGADVVPGLAFRFFILPGSDHEIRVDAFQDMLVGTYGEGVADNDGFPVHRCPDAVRTRSVKEMEA